MRIYPCLFVLLLVVLLAASFMEIPVHATSSWNIQTIDQASTGAGEIAAGSDNSIHLLYNHYENNGSYRSTQVMYARSNGSSWNNQTVPGAGGFYNFVLDSDNYPHILTEGFTIVSWTGSSWVTQNVTDEGPIKSFLALDSRGNPHIAYTFYNFSYPVLLRYASWTGINWDVQTLDSIPNISYDAVYLAFDSHNNPTILYGYDTPINDTGHNSITTAKLALWNGTAWNIQTVFSNLSYYGNMVLDSKGYPHFTYGQDFPIGFSRNSTLSYAIWNGSAWNSQVVVSNTNLGGGTSFLGLDSNDSPHIDFCSSTGVNQALISLMYAEWTSTGWDTQIVGPNSLAIYSGPIAMDTNGHTHITYTGYPSAYPLAGSEVYCMYATAEGTVNTPFPTEVVQSHTPSGTPSPTQTPSVITTTPTLSYNPLPTQIPSLPLSVSASLLIALVLVVIAAIIWYALKRRSQMHS